MYGSQQKVNCTTAYMSNIYTLTCQIYQYLEILLAVTVTHNLCAQGYAVPL